MKLTIATALAVASLATTAFAEGDAAKGEKTFKKCKACHAITNGDDTIVKGGKTGPNLYGVIGRTAGSYADFGYGADLVKAGEAGLVWDEETFEAYVKDPKGFLAEYLNDGAARSKMSFKLAKGGEDVYAYLVSVAE
ncbi:c-type cytochrome [Pseudoprimorskyibacter insulae]|uniref:Cytochrome c-551 n=1 Tax=Pseudoprimorskyibacter insulae TaxID=1695997 RepID=A0A2R8AU81_9RHOB|nr:c-type cytochrome [Pseudoprimorskyibacter insulae]SPF79434.1 Cytochrome c-551 [Pseudoprimorskyibacter insulae]